jgi:hypothetical protein
MLVYGTNPLFNGRYFFFPFKKPIPKIKIKNKMYLRVRNNVLTQLDTALGRQLTRSYVVYSIPHPYNKYETLSHTVNTYDKFTNTIYEFHNNDFNGYPPTHEKYLNIGDVTGRTNKEMYRDTVLRMNILYNMSYNVKYIWEHELQTATNILVHIHDYRLLLLDRDL